MVGLEVGDGGGRDFKGGQESGYKEPEGVDVKLGFILDKLRTD